jgi:hypothetical protein
VTAPDLPLALARPFAVPAPDKRAQLLATLNALTAWHVAACAPYRHIVDGLFGGPDPAAALEDVPYFPVRLFKSLELLSVPRTEVVKTLTSSGTTGHTPSRIFLDRETAMRQSRVLTAIMTSFLGSKRLPMVIVDSAELLKDRSRFNARAAGILGFSMLGRDHFYALDAELRLDGPGLTQFLARHAGEPVLAFGFTAIAWQHLLTQPGRFAFPAGSTLLHGGGWKRLADQGIDNAAFKAAAARQLGIHRVFNYYGMVEQVGSIFMECEQGHLHSPAFAEVIARDPHTLRPQAQGESGVLQVLSALPLSYPGHSLLTEDLGTVLGEDDCRCGRLGRYFAVHGRMAEAELRGCSDTRVLP